MTDIISMLAKAKIENNARKQSDSVASFFNSIQMQPSTNNPSLPIQIKQQNTLESIERNVIHQDTQNNNPSQNDLQINNSPLAMFLNSNNFNTVRTDTHNGAVIVSAKTPTATPPTFSSILQTQNIPNGTAKETKLITPNMLINSNNNNNNNNINGSNDKKQPEPLTRNQMLQALKYLIDNDEDFSKKVYDAYLKSMKK